MINVSGHRHRCVASRRADDSRYDGRWRRTELGTVGGAEEWRKIRNRAGANDRDGSDRTDGEARKRGNGGEKSTRRGGGGSFRGPRETVGGEQQGAIGMEEGTAEAMRSLTVVGTGGGVDGGGGGGGGGRSFNTQDQSRGERPRSTAFASLYLVPPPHSYTLWKTRRFFTRLSKEGKKK